MSEWPRGVDCLRLAEVDSTNAEAQRLARDGATGPVWVVAERQTMGRGRRGRPWTDHRGNFYATCLLTPPGGPTSAALRSFVAALALFDALVGVTGRPQLFALKWPNDVLLSGQKLAGILLEMCSATSGAAAPLAVGIGVNLAGAPRADVLEPGALSPISLAEATGLTISPEDFLDALAPAFARWEGQLISEGFAPVRRAWLSRAVRVGEEVVARLPGQEIHGVFRTIDETGAILLDTVSGPLALSAADIHFLPSEAGRAGVRHAAGH